MRETKSFNDDLIDLEELAGRTKKKQDDVEIVTAVAQQSNFSSRGDNKKKERKRSPYVIQKNIKMRIGMPELLADITSRIRSDSDQETLERAILALIEKEKLNDIKVKYNELIASYIASQCCFDRRTLRGIHLKYRKIKMQVNCSINHTLNQTATDDELRLLSSLIERDFFQPAQRAVVESFVSRRSIENYLNAHTSNTTELN